MKVLLTGATGFVGQNLVESISQHYSVVPIGSKGRDLRSQSSCHKLIHEIIPDVIIHAAGTVGGIGANKENPGKFMYENLIMGKILKFRKNI